MEWNEMQEAKYHQMTESPIPGLIARLAVPTICSMLITSIYNMADTYFVSQLGTDASAAVGVIFSLMAMIQAIGFTFGIGSSTCVSRLLGQKERQQACESLATAFFTAIAFGAVLAALGGGWKKAALTVFVLWAVQQADGMVISPRILGGVTGLSPAAVLIAIFVGSHVCGILGMLLALPVLMTFRTAYRIFVQRHENV